jgi:hypothetical protein
MPMKQVQTKSTLFIPSLATARRIDDTDTSFAIQAAVYRAEAKIGELRGQFETECSKVRSAMLVEIAALELGEEA